MPADANDPWKLRMALDGDDVAWASIVDEFGGVMWHWARSAGLDRSEAEDVVQTVWFRLADRGTSIEDPRRLPGWLAITTKREAQARRRKLKRAAPIDDLEHDYESAFTGDDAAGTRHDPERAAVASDLRRRLAEAFSTLGERCRELLTLVWDPEMSYAAIAEAMGTTVGAIGPMRLRCLDRLRVAAGLVTSQ